MPRKIILLAILAIASIAPLTYSPQLPSWSPVLSRPFDSDAAALYEIPAGRFDDWEQPE
jgi:hypothetical protein